MIFKGFGITDVGIKRNNNEDTFVCDTDHGVFLVADGMGGENYGEVASKLTAEYFYSLILPFVQDEDMTIPYEQPAGNEPFLHALEQAVLETNRSVIDYVHENKSHKGMGSTLTSVVFYDKKLHTGHIGDSRLYQLNRENIVQITRDQTKVQEMVDHGIITLEQARNHSQKNVITQCIGRKKRIKPEIISFLPDSNFTYLICSDGLTDMLLDGDIHRIVMQAPSLEEAGKQLVDGANAMGGKDNITVVLFQLVEK